MVQDLSPRKAFEFITGNFTFAWNCLANLEDERGISKGNFVFGFMAMNLLEFICRLCHNDQ
jgi:hypothetical protein